MCVAKFVLTLVIHDFEADMFAGSSSHCLMLNIQTCGKCFAVFTICERVLDVLTTIFKGI